MYIIVSVLGGCPASRGTFRSNWVVRETSGSSGTFAFRRETSGSSSNGWTAGRSDGRSDGDFLGPKNLNSNFKELNPKYFRV